MAVCGQLFLLHLAFFFEFAGLVLCDFVYCVGRCSRVFRENTLVESAKFIVSPSTEHNVGL